MKNSQITKKQMPEQLNLLNHLVNLSESIHVSESALKQWLNDHIEECFHEKWENVLRTIVRVCPDSDFSVDSYWSHKLTVPLALEEFIPKSV